jgi:hypothetical protein
MTNDIKDAARTDPNSDQFAVWDAALRLAVQGMVLRVAADYCEVQGYEDAASRQQALDRMDQALKESRQRGGGRGR